MKQSCVVHPANDRLVLIRQSYVDLCDGNHCAAALLNFFEYWHNIKMEHIRQAKAINALAESYGDEPTQDTSLYQFHNDQELQDGLCGLYGTRIIREALKLLESKGFIEVRRHPNPRYDFDTTKHFLFNPEQVRHSAKMPVESGKNAKPSGKNEYCPNGIPHLRTKNPGDTNYWCKKCGYFPLY